MARNRWDGRPFWHLYTKEGRRFAMFTGQAAKAPPARELRLAEALAEVYDALLAAAEEGRPMPSSEYAARVQDWLDHYAGWSK